MGKFKILSGDQALAHSVMGRLTVIYSVPGAGKTHLALTATKVGKTLFIDTENAAGKVFGGIPEELKNKENFSSVNVSTIAEAIEFINDPETNLTQYDMVVFDSATHLVEQEMRNIRRVKKLTFADWGDLGNNFKDLLSQLQTKGLNVIMTVHEEETADDSGVMQHRPKTEGKAAAAALTQRADNLLFIEVNDEGNRVLHTQPSPRFYAKSRDPLKTVYIGDEVSWENIAKDFSQVEEKNATAAQKKEVLELMEAAGVKDGSKFFSAVHWDGKGDLAVHNYIRGIDLLNNQIEATKILENAASSD